MREREDSCTPAGQILKAGKGLCGVTVKIKVWGCRFVSFVLATAWFALST